MRMIRFSAAHTFCVCGLFVLSNPTSLLAHAELDNPLGGETLSGGFNFPVEWHVTASHNTENWDLWYSTTSNTGPWIPIQMNIAPGNLNVDVPHFHDWYVPNADLGDVWVRLRQDNVDADYYSISGNFSVTAAATGDFTGNGKVNSADVSRWINNFGTSSGAFFFRGDDDGDGDVDGADFLNLLRNFGFGTGAALTIPEPTTFALGGIFVLLLVTRNRA